MNDVGIDMAKESFDATLLRADEPAEHGQFKNNRSGHKQFLKWLKRRVTEFETVRAVMEATNIYWEALADTLHEQGLKVSVVNPAAIKGFAQSQLQRNKTDKIDSRVIAHFSRQTDPTVWRPPLPHQRKLRALVRHKQALIKTRTQQLNRLASCNDDDVKSSLQDLVSTLDQQLDHLQAKIEALIDDHDDLRHNHQLIASIKGIGSDTAALLLAEFYDLEHYTSAKAVAADAGVTPAKFQSGTSVRRKAKMSRIGKASVRGSLYWPAQSAIQWNPLVSRLAERLRQRGKPFKVILVAAMRKLLHIAFGVVKNNTPFDPNFGHLSPAF
ncbi:MAG: IS110 family transposase [Anaerolineae bacterium]|nr:IS110 family transposase [Anaerolineae bacterium]